MNELKILLPGNWPALRRRLAEVEPPPVALDQEAWGMPYSWQEESPGASDCQKAEQIDFKCRTQASLLQLRGIRRTMEDGRFVNRPYGPGAVGPMWASAPTVRGWDGLPRACGPRYDVGREVRVSGGHPDKIPFFLTPFAAAVRPPYPPEPFLYFAAAVGLGAAFLRPRRSSRAASSTSAAPPPHSPSTRGVEGRVLRITAKAPCVPVVKTR